MVSVLACGALGPFAHAAAQERSPCPDVAPDASAADHALCWDTRVRRGAAGCTGEAEAACTRRLAGYCEDAALDDAAVASACFRALVRLGRHEAATTMAQYVRDDAPSSARCRAAYAGPVAFRVVTNPAGAEVRLDGESYGPAPVEVRLPTPWWTRRITVRFGSAAEGTVVDVPPERLDDAFDRVTCTTRDVVVRRPRSALGDPPRRAHPVSTAREGRRASTPGIVATVAGGVAAVAGGVLLVVAESWARDLHDLEPGATWDADRQAELDRIDPTRIVGASALGIGAITIGAGIALLLLDDGGSGERTPGSRAVAAGAGTAGWRWRF